MAKRNKVILTKEERDSLIGIINKGKHQAQTYRAAYILLNTDRGKFSSQISINKELAKILMVGMRTIDRVKKQFVDEGIEACLGRKPTTRIYELKIDEDVEANLIKIANSKPPKGIAKWSLRLLADKMVELNHVKSLSHEAVRNILKKQKSTNNTKT